MIMNQISDSMLKTLLSGDMKKISEELTCTEMNDTGIIINGNTEELEKGWVNLYINMANYINAHCTTSDKTDIMNRFLNKNDSYDEDYWSKFDKVCKILKLKPSNYIGGNEDGYYTYNYNHDLSHDMHFRILEDDYNDYYVLVSIHLAGDARSGLNSCTVLLEINDIDYFYSHDIDGWTKEDDSQYEGSHQILENTVKIVDGCFYDEDGYEILLSASLEY